MKAPLVLVTVLLSALPPAGAAWAQSAALPLPAPPPAHGLSIARLELARPPEFTGTGRRWVPSLLADVALGNSHTRVAASLARFPGVSDAASASIGGGLSLTQVVAERESPSWIGWITGGAGLAGLGSELRTGATVVDVAVAGGAALVFTPPGVGEVALSLAPRLQWRRLSEEIPGLERSAVGGGATLALDWGSQGNLGALVGLDLEWLSHRIPGDHRLQTTFRFGGSYRLLLFRRKPRLPPPEDR